jgi:FMN reductase
MTDTTAQPNDTVSIVAVIGSVTPPGRLRRAVEQALERLTERTCTQTHLIDLAETKIAFADGRPPGELGDDTAAVIDLLVAADVVLLATPVYRGSFTGALKNLLDQLPVETLEGRATAIVAMGQTQHHFLGAERHLRDVLAFFGAVVAPVASYLSAEDFTDGVPGRRASDELDALLSDTAELAVALRGRSSPPALRPLVARRRQRA